MKLSLFTPTNNPVYLPEVYDSLKIQDHQDWEWVILLNGQDREPMPPRFWGDDPRVKIHWSTRGSSNVGALKLEACTLCTGDAFVEMDHDDLLVPGALATINRGFEGGAGFVYSDSAVFEEDLTTWGYHHSHGWEHYPVTVYNRRFVVTKTFPVTPRSLCEVFYAPDHVRCWSRAAYFTAGGHDPSLSVGDDHDLICRTYLAGFPFHYTGNCCYLYRVHSTNTVKLRSAAIQEQQAKNRRRHLPGLVAEWCRREGLKTLDLLAEKKARNWHPDHPLALRVDGKKTVLDRAGPFGSIVASDVLQFVDPRKIVTTFNWLYHSLVPGGYLHVAVPSSEPQLVRDEHGTPSIVPARYADQNPLHRTRFNYNTFLHFCRGEFAQALPGVKCKFDLIQSEEFYPSADFEKFGMKLLRVDLCALKGQRHPGPKLI
jgi:hypothetical protein